MSQKTGIAWTDSTWNPVTGCKEISPGCANCYAARMAATRLVEHPRYKGLAVVGDNGHPHWTGEIRLHEDRLAEPLKWRKGRKVFVNDMSDTFHADVPHWFLGRMFAVMALARHHTFQVLTKRADLMARYLGWQGNIAGPFPRDWQDRLGPIMNMMAGKPASNPRPPFPWPLPNVWVGVSVENRQHGLPRIEHLRQTPAAVRFLSIEPLLEDLGTVNLEGISWVILGGESGRDARPCEVNHLRSLVLQCEGAGVPVFVKQLGANVRWSPRTGACGIWPESVRFEYERRGEESQHRINLRDPKGGNPEEWPAGLRVREFPTPQYNSLG